MSRQGAAGMVVLRRSEETGMNRLLNSAILLDRATVDQFQIQISNSGGSAANEAQAVAEKLSENEQEVQHEDAGVELAIGPVTVPRP